VRLAAAALLLALGLWALRGDRRAYAAFVTVGALWIPGRTGFRLHAPVCDVALTLAGSASAVTKWSHVLLFALFFLLTAAQAVERTGAAAWAVLGTLAFGVLIEIEQGATGTGTCRLRDLVPDAAGALVGVGVLSAWRAWPGRLGRRRAARRVPGDAG
jgi:hypothetical protein